MAGLVHLSKRFFGSLSDDPPGPSDSDWARRHLSDGEQSIWNRMSHPDQRHAITVARAVAETMDRTSLVAGDRSGPGGRRTIIATALLHDCGKVVSDFGTPARVAATIVWAVLSNGTAERWLAGPEGGVKQRLAHYRRHPELGAELLRQAGSDRLTSDWAAQHHQPENRWTVPVDIGRVLKACDDD